MDIVSCSRDRSVAHDCSDLGERHPAHRTVGCEHMAQTVKAVTFEVKVESLDILLEPACGDGGFHRESGFFIGWKDVFRGVRMSSACTVAVSSKSLTGAFSYGDVSALITF